MKHEHAPGHINNHFFFIFDETMRTEYDVRLKTLHDNYSAEQFAIKRSKAEIAKTMLAKGYSENEVTDITGLTIAQIETLLSIQ